MNDRSHIIISNVVGNFGTMALLGGIARICVFCLTAGGCVCAFFAASTCEFFYYQVPSSDGLINPYSNATESFVGIFGYYQDFSDSTSECLAYENRWMGALRNDESAYLITAQLAAIVGPSFGAAAFLWNLIEWFLFAPNWSYYFMVSLLVIAFCVQGCTFLVYAVDGFCFDDEEGASCQLELGGILSIASAGAFYASTIVLCCMPRDPPFCFAPKEIDDREDNPDAYLATKEIQVEDQEAPEQESEPEYYNSDRDNGDNTKNGVQPTWANSDNQSLPSKSLEDRNEGWLVPTQQVQQQYQYGGHPSQSWQHNQQVQQQQFQQYRQQQQQQPQYAAQPAQQVQYSQYSQQYSQQPQYQQQYQQYPQYQQPTTQPAPQTQYPQYQQTPQQAQPADPYANPFVDYSTQPQSYSSYR